MDRLIKKKELTYKQGIQRVENNSKKKKKSSCFFTEFYALEVEEQFWFKLLTHMFLKSLFEEIVNAKQVF